MLCACSREQKFHFEEAPQSPESLATRDFSVSALSSRTGDCDAAKFDDNNQVDDIESTLRETLSLNYEEARALLGRLEYQRGNFDAALQVFQGIDIRGLKPKMVKAIAERNRPRRNQRSRKEKLVVNVMSMHSAILLLEATLLKSKSLEGLGRFKDAAVECKVILEVMESAYPHGMPPSIADHCKLKEIFHRALELLPELWKRAGCLDETVSAYRRALVKPWKLNPQMCVNFQKELAGMLLYGGEDFPLSEQLQQTFGSLAPKTNIEEAILLLLILMKKMLYQEATWDPEIVNHLTFALSLSGQFELLANYAEELQPGVYHRAERWFFLALCYSAGGMDDAALNILRNLLGRSESEHKPKVASLLLASKLCCKKPMLASEGISFAERAKCATGQSKHFTGVSNHLLGVCYGNYARSCSGHLERMKAQKQALGALERAKALGEGDTEVIYSLAMELAVQRKLNEAKDFAVKYVELTGGSSVNGWRLLALLVSAEQEPEQAESVVDLALSHAGTQDQLELLRMRASLQVDQDQLRDAMETYRSMLALIRAQKENRIARTESVVKHWEDLEVEAWTALASIYAELGLHMDSNCCLEIAKSIGYFSPKTWHTKGTLLVEQSLHNDALDVFAVSLSIDADYVPSMVSSGAVLRKIGGEALLPIARSFLTNALKIEPTNHDAWLNLGLVYKLEGSLQEAAECFQKACELKESSPTTDL